MEQIAKLMIKKNGEIFFGPGVEALLMGIDSEKSVKMAAEKLNLSYSKAWTIIRNAEKGSGECLVERVHGGTGGGNSALTAKGRELLERYSKFKEEANALLEDCFRRNFYE
ncbi:MAG: LysR family transcriptional regulator [Spirochaetales bacterium]|nr:LysR family transcriptional regulator [Spirochaetales bacterium]